MTNKRKTPEEMTEEFAAAPGFHESALANARLFASLAFDQAQKDEDNGVLAADQRYAIQVACFSIQYVCNRLEQLTNEKAKG